MLRKPMRRTLAAKPQPAPALDYRSDVVTQRLEKIAEHYVQLEQVLTSLERKMPPPPAPTIAADANSTAGPGAASAPKPR